MGGSPIVWKEPRIFNPTCAANESHGSHVDVLGGDVHAKQEGVGRIERDRDDAPEMDVVPKRAGQTYVRKKHAPQRR